jgi:hypothetical protein
MAVASAPAIPTLDAEGDPRELIRSVLPSARQQYVQTWAWLKTAAHPRSELVAYREQVSAIAEAYAAFSARMTERYKEIKGEDLETAKVIVEQVERLVEAWRRLVTLSPHAINTTKDLLPKAVGCGPPPKRTGPPRAHHQTWKMKPPR